MTAVFRTSLLAIAIGAGFTAAAEAQNQYQQQIISYLTRAASTIQSQGYSADRAPITGSLNDDASENYQINLTAGVRYAILGVCDNDCNDVDLQIYGANGNKIAEDIETDDVPVLEFIAQYTGTYRLRVMMPGCSTSPCYYGIQVFTR